MTETSCVVSVSCVVVLASVGWSAPQETRDDGAAQTPGSRLITVTGVLTDAEGHPRTGSVGLTFSLYAEQAGGEALWRERQVVVADAPGRYSVLLGATVPGGVPPEVFGDGKAQWLGVQVEGEAEQPRVLLVAVPYALRAADADTLGGKPLASFVLSEELTKAVDERVASTTTGTAAVARGGRRHGRARSATRPTPTPGTASMPAPPSRSGRLQLVLRPVRGDHVTTGNCNAFVGQRQRLHQHDGRLQRVRGHATPATATPPRQSNTFVGDRAGYHNIAAQQHVRRLGCRLHQHRGH